MVFKINTQMQKRQISVVEEVDLNTDIQKEGEGANQINDDLNVEGQNGYVPLRGNNVVE